jgi:hypothetical protein
MNKEFILTQIEVIKKRKEEIIRDKMMQINLSLPGDLEMEMDRRFPCLKCEVEGDVERWYYNDGTRDGMFLVEFKNTYSISFEYYPRPDVENAIDLIDISIDEIIEDLLDKHNICASEVDIRLESNAELFSVKKDSFFLFGIVVKKNKAFIFYDSTQFYNEYNDFQCVKK